MTYITHEVFQKHMANARQAKYLAVDTEGTLNHPFAETWGLSLSGHGTSEYFSFRHMIGDNLPSNWLAELKDVIENHSCLIFHNAKHDLRSLQVLDIDYRGKFYDTMIMAHMVDENFYSKRLDALAKKHLNLSKDVSPAMDAIIKGFGWGWIPSDVMRPYASNDTYITELLFYSLYPEFKAQEFDDELWDIEQKFTRLLAKMENTGVKIDTELSERELERGLKIMDEQRKALGFNPGSTKELGKFFIEELRMPIVKPTETTKKLPESQWKPSFDKEAMATYDELLSLTNDDRAKRVLIYRGWQKTTSSNYKAYLDLLHPDGRLRPNFKIHGTKTGRLSCEKPNLQQIPREGDNDWNGNLKKTFISDEGFTPWGIDYSQLELRLGAALGKESGLIEVFNDRKADVFKAMATELGMSRQNTKTLNYTIMFGGGATRLSHVFGISIPAAKAILKNYWTKYDGLARASGLAAQRCRENGYIRYWTGRRRHFPYRSDDDARKAFNSWCQGGAFEIVKRAMIKIDDAGLNNEECQMNLTIHDELRFDIQNGKEDTYLPELKNLMEDVPKEFGVKFYVSANKWGEK